MRDAAESTKLPIDVVQAIERNDFDRLPPGMYRKAYIRTLAAEVGVDPDDMAERYARQFDAPPPLDLDREMVRHDELVQQLTSPGRPSRATLVVLVVLAAGWFMLRPAPAPVPPPTPLDGGDGHILAARAPLELREPIVAADTGRAAFEPAAAVDAAPIRIDLVASGWCWVAAEADGERVIYRLVEPGEDVALEAERVLSLRLGNAGSVMLSINGGPRRLPGGPGQVVELQLTSENVEAVAKSLAARDT